MLICRSNIKTFILQTVSALLQPNEKERPDILGVASLVAPMLLLKTNTLNAKVKELEVCPC